MTGCNLELLWKFLLRTANNSTHLLTLAMVGPSILEPLSRGAELGEFQKRKTSHVLCWCLLFGKIKIKFGSRWDATGQRDVLG